MASAFARPYSGGVVTAPPVQVPKPYDKTFEDNANRGYQDFLGAAGNKVNYSTSFTDPRTGQTMRYDPANGGGGGDGKLDDFSFESALQRVQPALPPTPAAAALPGRVQASSPADAAAAESAQFGRAKDRIGRMGRGSMTALQNEFSARGMGGSQMEGAATGELLGDLQGQTGEVIRDQSIQALQRQRQVEDRNYAGDINQRGQDIGFTTTTRGQDITAADNRAALQVPLLQLIAANRKRRLY